MVDGDDVSGGTAWMKDAMGSDNGDESPPTSNNLPGFTPDEMNDMDELILFLSKITDDGKRRERLSAIFEKELADATQIASLDDDSVLEVPRFAKLFQNSLDKVGEKVQTAAREVAMEQQRNAVEINQSDDDERLERVKSQEELQLWALIDMMVQSKTRVKLHMGSLGSKGEFR
eukprot:CAMPEP_0172529390 /NCGR_PEP_ID=MMETSP1067-20121228/3480_1 /TAXON_ID=265564 ORGANISM="Thalassiosira punctigera, Strain Tpunct2005C2" /NCGR_SAMPLE_ID=MMETSP1067 /ASSEMBLY_ACC=CAM_ASM_000444 /LENGTH=173 /DNA_ID=CAMNT_0013313431 /DNA_START=282 /DNA_END=803 /DNA_ORIENTATION=-